MFKNLRTSRKLFLLCGMFLIALAVTTYGLVAEKLIAIEFAKKELVGSRYLATLRGVYEEILLGSESADPAATSPEEILDALHTAEAESRGLQTADLERELTAAVRALSANGSPPAGGLILDALAAAQALAVRIGDDSNLTLDPDLDTYYLQNLVVARLPELLGQLGEMQTRLREIGSRPAETVVEHTAAIMVVEGLVRRSIERLPDILVAAYRGNADGQLRASVEPTFEAMIFRTNAYVDDFAPPRDVASDAIEPAENSVYADAVTSTIAGWTVAQSELDRLLQQRIDGLVSRLRGSLVLTGLLAGLSVILAILTYRHIVKPLERFETVARRVSETKDYTLRVDETSLDEIGRLAEAFNKMLSALAAAREREISEQTELARVSRLTTMGAMTASIAHEINQPLAAIVANSNAALRWLGRSTPDLDEARAALKRIVTDGHRASEVIAGVRAAFKKESREKTWLDLNELVRMVLPLVRGSLKRHAVTLETMLGDRLPQVLGDRVQLEQVLLNLIVNASEAMRSVNDRPRRLVITSAMPDAGGVTISVADNGAGIDPQDRDRIFEGFFTTKSTGMGIGLFISRSIIESHGGRLWASPGDPYGTVFHFMLPTGSEEEA